MNIVVNDETKMMLIHTRIVNAFQFFDQTLEKIVDVLVFIAMLNNSFFFLYDTSSSFSR